MTRKTVPIRTVLTNRRDTESDLGGVQLIERKTSEDRHMTGPASNVNHEPHEPHEL